MNPEEELYELPEWVRLDNGVLHESKGSKDERADFD